MNDTATHPTDADAECKAVATPTEKPFPETLRSHAAFLRSNYNDMDFAEASVLMAGLEVSANRIEELEREVSAGRIRESTMAMVVTSIGHRAERAEAALAESQALLGARWIPVTTHMPEEGVEVLVYHVLGDRGGSPSACDIGSRFHGRWIFPWDRTGQNPPPDWVTHWMPLPSPPAMETQQNDHSAGASSGKQQQHPEDLRSASPCSTTGAPRASRKP